MTLLFRLINYWRQFRERRWPQGTYRDQLATWEQVAQKEHLRLVKGRERQAT